MIHAVGTPIEAGLTDPLVGQTEVLDLSTAVPTPPGGIRNGDFLVIFFVANAPSSGDNYALAVDQAGWTFGGPEITTGGKRVKYGSVTRVADESAGDLPKLLIDRLAYTTPTDYFANAFMVVFRGVDLVDLQERSEVTGNPTPIFGSTVLSTDQSLIISHAINSTAASIPSILDEEGFTLLDDQLPVDLDGIAQSVAFLHTPDLPLSVGNVAYPVVRWSAVSGTLRVRYTNWLDEFPTRRQQAIIV